MACYRFAATPSSYHGLFYSKCCPPAVGERRCVERSGFASFCGRCGAWSSESNRLSQKFQRDCKGPAATNKSRWKEKDIMSQLHHGINPLTEEVLESGRPVPLTAPPAVQEC